VTRVSGGVTGTEGHVPSWEWPLTWVGVAGFEPAASSSRSQVSGSAASTSACLTWERPSVDFRWGPPLVVAIVTHLVTRSFVGGAVVVGRTTTSMPTTGACEDRTTLAASKRCLRSWILAVVRPRCCTFCSTKRQLRAGRVSLKMTARCGTLCAVIACRRRAGSRK
jgi:hypothetical protein